MIDNYWVFLFLLLFLFYLLPKKSRMLKHPCKNIVNHLKVKFKWKYFMFISLFLLLLASSGIAFNYKENILIKKKHKFVLINDASGSMVDTTFERGASKNIKAVEEGNVKFLSLLGKEDIVSLLVFSDESYIVCPFTEDFDFLEKKLKRIDYSKPPLNGGTDIQVALFSGVDVILANNNVSNTDIVELSKQFYNSGSRIYENSLVKKLLKKNYEGNNIILFTDGIFSTLHGTQHTMSAYKILDFCRLANIKVNIISLYPINPDVINYCKKTGGGFLILEELSLKKLENVYKNLAESMANDSYTKEISKNYYLNDILAIISLIFFLLALILKNTKQLNYVEV